MPRVKEGNEIEDDDYFVDDDDESTNGLSLDMNHVFYSDDDDDLQKGWGKKGS